MLQPQRLQPTGQVQSQQVVCEQPRPFVPAQPRPLAQPLAASASRVAPQPLSPRPSPHTQPSAPYEDRAAAQEAHSESASQSSEPILSEGARHTYARYRQSVEQGHVNEYEYEDEEDIPVNTKGVDEQLSISEHSSDERDDSDDPADEVAQQLNAEPVVEPDRESDAAYHHEQDQEHVESASQSAFGVVEQEQHEVVQDLVRAQPQPHARDVERVDRDEQRHEVEQEQDQEQARLDRSAQREELVRRKPYRAERERVRAAIQALNSSRSVGKKVKLVIPNKPLRAGVHKHFAGAATT